MSMQHEHGRPQATALPPFGCVDARSRGSGPQNTYLQSTQEGEIKSPECAGGLRLICYLVQQTKTPKMKRKVLAAAHMAGAGKWRGGGLSPVRRGRPAHGPAGRGPGLSFAWLGNANAEGTHSAGRGGSNNDHTGLDGARWMWEQERGRWGGLQESSNTQKWDWSAKTHDERLRSATAEVEGLEPFG